MLSCCGNPAAVKESLDFDEVKTRDDVGTKGKTKRPDDMLPHASPEIEPNDREPLSPGSKAEKGKGNGRNGDTSPKSLGGRAKAASLQYLDGLPVLPNQLQQMSGTYAWIREENAPKHREARLDAGRQLQEAFEKGGFAVSSGGKKHKVRFTKLSEMLSKTQSVSVAAGLPALKDNPKHQTEFMYGGNPIERAVEMTLEGRRVASVNAASGHHAGGGFTSGGRHALEEALCSQSTLYPSLDKVQQMAQGKLPYIPVDGAIVSPSVEVFRRSSDQGYVMMTRVVTIAGIVSVAMYNKNNQVRDAPMDAPEDNVAYEQGVKQKFKAMSHAAASLGADAIVVPDLGCGVFNNDPVVVGRLCGEALKPYLGYFQKVLFTGKPDFYQSAAQALNFQAVARHPNYKPSNESLPANPNSGCCVCGQPLGGRGTGAEELSLLLNLKTGKREGGLQFLHRACEADLDKKFPDCQAMTLPQATSDAKSFLLALDVDGNGVLDKEEVRCAVAALWVGAKRDMDREFEEKWKQWDVDGDGQLCLDEVANPNMPASFLSWVRATAVRRLSEKLPSS
jgi:uncharacterized protein (TIGR02452 family)